MGCCLDALAAGEEERLLLAYRKVSVIVVGEAAILACARFLPLGVTMTLFWCLH